MSCLKEWKRRWFQQTTADRQQVPLERSSPTSLCCRQVPGELSLARKLCFAVGGVPYQITSVAISISLQIFLLDVVQLDASYVSMVLFVSRAWDAVTDPLVGFLVSRSKWTRCGKLTPWMLVSSPFAVVSYVLMWFVPQTGSQWPPVLSGIWFLVAACLFETLMSCYHVPYVSLNMFLGGNQGDRDSATAYRMTVEMTAMLLASVVQGHVVSVYNRGKQEACEQQDTSGNTATADEASHQEMQMTFLTSALVIGGMCFLCSLVLLLGVKEQRASVCSDTPWRPPYVTSMKMLICHVPYRRLVLGFVTSTFAFQMSLGNFALFCSHVARLGAHFQHLLLVLLASAAVAVPLWQILLLRIGKKPTVFIGLSFFIPAAAAVPCCPSNLPLVMTMCILMGFSVATVFLLPWSMLPDVVEDFAKAHPSCTDVEPLFVSCFALCVKLAGGVSLGLSTATLQFVGYRSGACHHGDSVVTALVMLFSPVPIALLLVGMMFFHWYPIKETQEPLTPDQPEASSPSSSGEDAAAGASRTCLQSAGSRFPQTSTVHSCPSDVRPQISVHSHLNHQRRSSERLPPEEAPRPSKRRSKVSWV